ncbi:36503_t:CDS:2, partial [Racocetra persica]
YLDPADNQYKPVLVSSYDPAELVLIVDPSVQNMMEEEIFSNRFHYDLNQLEKKFGLVIQVPLTYDAKDEDDKLAYQFMILDRNSFAIRYVIRKGIESNYNIENMQTSFFLHSWIIAGAIPFHNQVAWNSNFNGGGNFSSQLSVAEVLLVLKEIQSKLAEQIQKGDDDELEENSTKEYKKDLDSVIANLEAKKVKNKEWIDINGDFSDEKVEVDLKAFNKQKDMEDGLNAILTKLKPSTFADSQVKTRYKSIEESIRKFVPTPTGGNKD